MRKQKSKLFTVILVVVNLCVWGLISYKVIEYVLNLGDENGEISGEEIVLEDETNVKFKAESKRAIEYKELKRNPFLLSIKKISKEKPVAPSEQVAKQPIIQPASSLYSLKGIMNNEGKEMAIVEEKKNGNTLFLKVGEKQEDLKLKKIIENKVIVEYNSRVDTLSM